MFECLACRLLVDGYLRDIPLYIDVSSTDEALSVSLFEPLASWPNMDGTLNQLNNQPDHFKYHVDTVEGSPCFITTAAISWKGTLSLGTFDRWLDVLIGAHRTAAHAVRPYVATKNYPPL